MDETARQALGRALADAETTPTERIAEYLRLKMSLNSGDRDHLDGVMVDGAKATLRASDLAALLDERELLLAVVETALAYAKPESGDTTCGDLACEYCAFVRAVRAYRAAARGDGKSDAQ